MDDVTTQAEPQQEQPQTEAPQADAPSTSDADAAALAVAKEVVQRAAARDAGDELPPAEDTSPPDEQIPGTGEEPSDEQIPDGDEQDAEGTAEASELGEADAEADSGLRDEAKGLGIPQRVIDALEPELLADMVAQRYVDLGSAVASDEAEPDEPETAPQPPPQATPAQAEPQPDAEDADAMPDLSALEDDEFLSDGAKAAFKALAAHTQKVSQQLAAAQQQLSALTTHTEEQQAETEHTQHQQMVATFDASVSALGDDWKDVFGEGGIDDLMQPGRGGNLQPKPNCKQFVENRKQLWQRLGLIENGYIRSGQEMPPDEQLVKMALRTTDWWAEKTKQQAQRDVTDKVKQAGRRMIAKPTHAQKPTDPLAAQEQREMEAARRAAAKNRAS